MPFSKHFEEAINSIENGTIEPVDTYLTFHIFSEGRAVRYIIEQLYGYAVVYGNIQAISMLNLFVRNNNIKINKYTTMHNIYDCECRKLYTEGKKNYGMLAEYSSFEEADEHGYINWHWYSSMFD